MKTMKELYPNKWISIPLSILLTPFLLIFVMTYVNVVTLLMVFAPHKYGNHMYNKIEKHKNEKAKKALEDRNE